MNNSFFLQQIQKTSNLDGILISRQNKLNLMADFMKLRYENPRMKQSQIANQISLSTSTLQRYRSDKKMLSPYRTNPKNTNKRTKKASITNFDNDSHTNYDVKIPQLTSNDLKSTSKLPVRNKKNKLKGGANIEINEHYLDEILHNKSSSMELAMQIISTGKTVRNDTLEDLNEFNSQSLTTQYEKGEQLISMMPAIKTLLIY